MPILKFNELIELVCDLGKEIVSRRAECSISRVRKMDGSLVTNLDIEMSEILVEALRYVGLPIISEEEEMPTIKPTSYVIVDPIDGTKNFCEGGTMFSINVAVVKDLVPVEGLIYYPMIDLMYLSYNGEVWQIFEDKRIKVGRGSTLDSLGLTELFISEKYKDLEGAILTNMRSLESSVMKKVFGEHGVFDGKVLTMPTSLKYILAALGICRGALSLGTLHEWDTAPSDCIINALGVAFFTIDAAGTFQKCDGVKYPKEGFARSYFAVQG